MAQIYTFVQEPDGQTKWRWLDLIEYGFDDDGFLAWFSYQSFKFGRITVCILNRDDMDLKDWVNMLLRIASGTAIGIAFSGPFGIIGAITGFLSFIRLKGQEGYYETVTKQLVHVGRIHKNNKNHFRP